MLAGPRQCGKTTLAREFLDANSANYFDLEDPASLARLDEPMTALGPLRGLVVIDEVQRRPDLFPVLVALATNCEGTSKIKGVNRLIYKESDRGLALKNEFNKIGVRIDIKDDIMFVIGSDVSGGEVYAHNDHRIAMALTLAAFNSSKPVTIIGAECVNKTYPEFFDDMEILGVEIK